MDSHPEETDIVLRSGLSAQKEFLQAAGSATLVESGC